ncbi:hypothetical protein [Algoriphagus namhaensis]
MKISTAIGKFKIIQTAQDRDELLMMGSWNDLVRSFDSSRTFLVDREKKLFGVFVCKQECLEFLSKALKQLDNQSWDQLQLDTGMETKKYLA